MNRVSVIDHKGRKVILLDFSGVTQPADWAAAVADTRRLFATLPPDRSALTLTDVSGTRYNRDTVDALKELTVANTAFVKAGAVVNTSVMHRAIIGMIALFARRKFEVFETRAQALDWLVAQ
jgi:hypothetical protein